MANGPEDDSSYDRVGDDAVPAPPLPPEELVQPSPELVQAAEGATIPSKLDEVKEQVVEAPEGPDEDAENKESRGESLDRLNTALVLSVAAVAIVGALVAIAKKLKER